MLILSTIDARYAVLVNITHNYCAPSLTNIALKSALLFGFFSSPFTLISPTADAVEATDFCAENPKPVFCPEWPFPLPLGAGLRTGAVGGMKAASAFLPCPA